MLTQMKFECAVTAADGEGGKVDGLLGWFDVQVQPSPRL